MANTFSLPEGTHTVAMGMGDLNGIMRGKNIPASHWPSICEDGCALSIALLALDMTCDVWDTPYVNFDNGYPDMYMHPLTQPVALPWAPGTAFCLGRAAGHDHKPVPIDPREALVKQVKRAKAMGFEVQIGPELEFYLLDPETRLPKDKGIQVYSLARAAQLEHVLGPIRRLINECGIAIEQSNPEYAAGQVEVNIRYGEALAAADQVIMFRSLVKQLAAEHGYLASFMAKPFHDESGSGFHTHHSLWKDGVNLFSDQGHLSQLGKNYLAGMQKRMAETSLAGSTTPNSYRRRQPYTFCPINTAWGVDNRTVGLRVIEGKDSAVRIEKRDASADCNPYFLMACDIAAGLDGIEHALQPGPITEGNAYEDNQAEALPLTLDEALALAKSSEFMARVCGEDAFAILAQQAEREIQFVAAQVTPVELDRYLESF